MASNILFLLSDEHARRFSGCYGNDVVNTPNIDALSARGATFDAAYCNSPICVPSRASLATGTYPHRTGYWDNAHPYDGGHPTWHHHLRDAGHEVVSIGKLHYRGPEDDAGFSQSHHPIYVPDGQGDIIGLLRKNGPRRKAASAMADKAGPGSSGYSEFDNRVAGAAEAWLKARTAQHGKPWVLYVSFVLPHFPLIAPPEFFHLYDGVDIPLPDQYAPDERPSNAGVDAYRNAFNYDDYFDDKSLRIALQAYYGMCSYMDHNIGRVLAALKEAGLEDDTLVIYGSDHGESLGNRGLWGKSVLYDDAVAIPLMMAGPGVAKGARCKTPVSLVDIYPTIVQAAGGCLNEVEKSLPGSDLRDVATQVVPARPVFSEYHAAGSESGGFMLRKGEWKLIFYVGHPPMLFNLKDDPGEKVDLAGRAETKEIQEDLDAELRRIVIPEAADARAFSDQARRIEELGGIDVIRAKGEIGFTPAPKS